MKNTMMKIRMGQLFLTIGFLFLAFSAQAQMVSINVDYEDDPMFDEKNVAPGWYQEKDFKVENDGDVVQDLYFEINDLTNNFFGDVLKLYVIDKSSGKYYIGGIGDRFTLRKAEKERPLFVERLNPGEKNTYKVKIKFDRDAGNEYMSKETKFDIKVGFVGEPVSENTPLPLRSGQIAGGNEGGEGEEGVGESEKKNDSGEIGNGLLLDGKGEGGNKEKVAGETSAQCRDEGIWLWVGILVGYLALFNFNSFYKLAANDDLRWFWHLVYTVGSLAGWYYWDNCQKYVWFPVLIVVLGAFSYYKYLKKFHSLKVKAG